MTEHHEPRGRSILKTAGLAAGLCVLAFAVPDSLLQRVGAIFGKQAATTSAFADEISRLDASLEAGEAVQLNAEERALVFARRLTRAGPMTPEEMRRAADMHKTLAGDALLAQLEVEFPRLDRDRMRAEVQRFRRQLPPGASPTSACGSCHRETLELPAQNRFDVAGIYPFAGETADFAGGRRVPILSEAIELATEPQARGRSCGDCHSGHGEDGFVVDREQRIQNMGLWANVKPSDPNTMQIEVKVRNAASAHLVPAGRVAPAYVVTVQARQKQIPLKLRFGSMLPKALRTEGREAGIVFARDFRDAAGRPTTDPAKISTLFADTRLQSGRFDQSNYLFDRVDDSVAQIDVVLWHLPDVTTWKGAKAIRRAYKPERPR